MSRENEDGADDDRWGTADDEEANGDNWGTTESGESDGDKGDEDSQTTLWGILVFVLIGGGLIYGGLHLQSEMPGADETVKMNATVLESDYTQRGSGSDRQFVIRVTYEYTVDGQTYTSSNVKAGAESYTVDRRERAELLATEQWAAGNTVEADVDPDDPETAYLADYLQGDRLERKAIHYGLMGVGGLMVLASLVSLAKKGRRRLA
ncbi:DUF3592 domain-containing protein [Halapricum salinum]|uniref:DUF3592 domain-containing protein n=1 Tax=Halapricum salinum TaxID=1457250 RepID=A0A4D6HEC8_9EURY|nr:DUF3592 domain-containing protein [Halapricum salinum]QCC51935.1 DUF3592 domain-containing protein [Halapricum salinum]